MKMTQTELKKEIIEWVLTLIIPVIIALLIHNFLFTFARVDGSSMLDTLHHENILGVSVLHYRINEPKRGEIVTCHYDQTKTLYVKRIIGLPGETIRVEEDGVYVNDVKLKEDYLTRIDHTAYGEYAIGSDEVFVMGDNRPNSRDSRLEGPLPKNYLHGRVLFISYPFDEIKNLMHLPSYT